MKRSNAAAIALLLLAAAAAAALFAAAPAAATPHSLVPANGGLVAANAQVFSWSDNLAQGPIDHWYVEMSRSPSVDYWPWGYFSGDLVYTHRGLTNASVNLTAEGKALAPGTYYWHVGGYYGPLGSLGTAWSQVQSFTIRSATATAPTIAVNPASLTFTVEQGDLTWHGPQNLAVSNIGGSTLISQTQVNPAMWITWTAGSVALDIWTIPVYVRPTSDVAGVVALPVGTYTTDFVIVDGGSSPPATNSPKKVPVTLKVVAADGAAPTGASIKIRNGRAATNTARVTLYLAASDVGSGMGEMRFSNDGVFWSAWVPYAATRPGWVLPTGDGVKTVAAQFRDRVGNETGMVSDDIVLDMVRPVTKALAAASVRRGKVATLKYRIDDADPNGGTATVVIRIKTRERTTVKTLKLGKKPVNTDLAAKFTCKLATKTYKYWVYATDAAGNVQATIGRNKLVVR